MGEFHGNQHVTRDEYEYEDLREAAIAFASEHGRSPTTDEAANDERFPSLATIYRILDGSWNDLLADAGLERGEVGAYGPEEKVAMLRDIRSVLNSVDSEHLTTRKYAEHGEYGGDTIKKKFGSWSEACRLARVETGKKYGVTCEGPTGETLDSLLELQVAQSLYERGLDYDAHPPLDGTNWVGDFQLPAFDLWVEVDGFADGERPNATDFERKLQHYEAQGMDYVVVGSTASLDDELRDRSTGP